MRGGDADEGDDGVGCMLWMLQGENGVPRAENGIPRAESGVPRVGMRADYQGLGWERSTNDDVSREHCQV